MTHQTEPTHGPVSQQPKPLYRAGREPSLTAMGHAYLRYTHATAHTSPIFADTRSVQLVPTDVRQQTQAYDAIVLMSVIRYRVLSDRLPEANGTGIRRLVILGAGLDTTGFALPRWPDDWRVFEVDHPATQDWKRARIADLC